MGKFRNRLDNQFTVTICSDRRDEAAIFYYYLYRYVKIAMYNRDVQTADVLICGRRSARFFCGCGL